MEHKKNFTIQKNELNKITKLFKHGKKMLRDNWTTRFCICKKRLRRAWWKKEKKIKRQQEPVQQATHKLHLKVHTMQAQLQQMQYKQQSMVVRHADKLKMIRGEQDIEWRKFHQRFKDQHAASIFS